ncbi:MAG: hypothetical protein B7X29_10950 [Halothiobacillus sp. 13-55-115]|nr:MAG: hypothetical protein B7X29_10950 [Halothiobacillus sp. 13-55-115]
MLATAATRINFFMNAPKLFFSHELNAKFSKRLTILDDSDPKRFPFITLFWDEIINWRISKL